MSNTRPGCYEIPSVYVALAVTRRQAMLQRVDPPSEIHYHYVYCRDCEMHRNRRETSLANAKVAAEVHARSEGHVVYWDSAPITDDAIAAMEQHVDVRA